MEKNDTDNLDKRKLTKAELKRKAEFEKLGAQLEAQGYTMHSLTMSTLFGNVIAVVLTLPIVILFFVWYMAAHDGFELTLGYGGAGPLLLLIGMFLLMIVHELIHGITWAAFAKEHWKAISFGFIVQYVTPYCNCRAPLKRYQIILGALMPTVLLGMIPAAAGVLLGDSFLFILAVIMIVGGGGDMACVCKALAYRSPVKDRLYIDHPYELGIVIYERKTDNALNEG